MPSPFIPAKSKRIQPKRPNADPSMFTLIVMGSLACACLLAGLFMLFKEVMPMISGQGVEGGVSAVLHATQLRSISLDELQLHHGDQVELPVWLCLKEKVYDISHWLGEHPGGRKVLAAEAGKPDGYSAFAKVGHNNNKRVAEKLRTLPVVGVFIPTSSPAIAKAAAKPAEAGANATSQHPKGSTDNKGASSGASVAAAAGEEKAASDTAPASPQKAEKERMEHEV
eukprot:g2622.t1